MQIEAPQVNQPQIAAAAAELQNFPISEDPSDDDLLPLKSGNAEVHMESFELPQKRGILAERDMNQKKMKLADGSSSSIVQTMFKQQTWFQQQQLKQQQEFQARIMKLLTK